MEGKKKKKRVLVRARKASNKFSLFTNKASMCMCILNSIEVVKEFSEQLVKCWKSQTVIHASHLIDLRTWPHLWNSCRHCCSHKHLLFLSHPGVCLFFTYISVKITENSMEALFVLYINWESAWMQSSEFLLLIFCSSLMWKKWSLWWQYGKIIVIFTCTLWNASILA